MVHGFAGSTYDYRYVAPWLQHAGWSLVLMDLPGFGYSDRGDHLDPRNDVRARLAWRLLDALEHADGETTTRPAPPYVLCGHSMGAMTVMHMAQQQPARTRCVVSLSGYLAERIAIPMRCLLSWAPVRWAARKLAARMQQPERVRAMLTNNGVTREITDADLAVGLHNIMRIEGASIRTD